MATATNLSPLFCSRKGFVSKIIFTIGHSNHSIDNFLALLKEHNVTALADVRSTPYSKYTPQFSKDSLKRSLANSSVVYVFLGKELGARSENLACYRAGKVQFELLARDPLFVQGLERVDRGATEHTIAIMCAEKDPLECHRAVLVARNIAARGIAVAHILSDGSIETQEQMEQRMMKILHVPNGDLLRTKEECLAEAYKLQGERIAWEDDSKVEADVEKNI